MAKRFPIIPARPELICWGCDKYCPADAMACGNGSDRTQHPVELFGEDWMAFGLDAQEAEEPVPRIIENRHPGEGRDP
ncbi:MAG: DUF3079 domain-containing protein [Telluria sp.]